MRKEVPFSWTYGDPRSPEVVYDNSLNDIRPDRVRQLINMGVFLLITTAVTLAAKGLHEVIYELPGEGDIDFAYNVLASIGITILAVGTGLNIWNASTRRENQG